MKFVCNCCGIEQREYPALVYPTPEYYTYLSKEEQDKAKMNTDTCIIQEGDETYRFIRGVFVQKVIDSCQDLEYGLWVSLSEKSFLDYKEQSHKAGHKEVYFGWLNAQLPDYEPAEMENIKTLVITQGNSLRPIIEVVTDQENQTKFVADCKNGITTEEALKRIKRVVQNKG